LNESRAALKTCIAESVVLAGGGAVVTSMGFE